MSRYIYSIVRCLPDPRTGEFVNVAAVAGDPITGDWSYRQLSNLERVRKFAGHSALQAALSCLLKVGDQIDENRVALLEDQAEPLAEEWLERLHHDHRNVVQFSPPAPLLAEDAEEALGLIFEQLLIDPVASHRPRGVTRHDLRRSLRDAFRQAAVADEYVRAKVQIHVGEKVHSPIDFAIANGRVVQLTQAWSFCLGQVDDVPMKVKAWGYALKELRGGVDSRVVDSIGRVSSIDSNVDLQVLVAPPETSDQAVAFEEAEQVFADVGAEVHVAYEVGQVGARAAELAQLLG